MLNYMIAHYGEEVDVKIWITNKIGSFYLVASITQFDERRCLTIIRVKNNMNSKYCCVWRGSSAEARPCFVTPYAYYVTLKAQKMNIWEFGVAKFIDA